MRPVSVLLPSIAVAAAATSWGLWWIPLRAFDRGGLTGGWTLFLLYAASALLMSPAVLLRWRRVAAGGWPGILLGFLYGTQLALWSYAIIIGEVVRVTLLFYLAPVWGTLLAVFLFREPMTLLRAAALALGLAGAAAVLGSAAGLPLPRTLAEWLGLWTGVQFALATAYSRRRPDLGGFEATFFTFVTAAGLGLAILWLAPAGLDGGLLLARVPLLAAMALLLVIPSYWLVLWGAAHLDPGRVSTLLLLEVAAAAISVTLLTDEPFGWRELVGCCLVIGAGFASALDQLRARAARGAAA